MSGAQNMLSEAVHVIFAISTNCICSLPFKNMLNIMLSVTLTGDGKLILWKKIVCTHLIELLYTQKYNSCIS